MGSLERSFDNGVRRAVTGRTRQVNRAGANDRYRRGAEVHYEITCSAQRRLRTSKLPLFDF